MERRELARLLGAQHVNRAAQTLVLEADAAKFRAEFAAACAGEGLVFLGNPAWGAMERAQVATLMGGGPVMSGAAQPGAADEGWLMIPTGGSSGLLKFARHDTQTLGAAVEGFLSHFGMRRVNAFGTLPLHHVSGLMGWLRCAWSEGQFVAGDWKDIERGVRPDLPKTEDGWVTSLVPTQLERLLRSADAVAWLKQFSVIFLGGAPATAELLNRAAQAGLPLALTYGMTETAAMVAALRPGEFLAGERSVGGVMPHARFELGAHGEIRIASEANFRGYFPDWRDVGAWFETSDVGEADERGHWKIHGRSDAAIITGGEKVQPAEVEAALRGAAQCSDIAVIGVPDAEWGERVVAVFSAEATCSVEVLQSAAAQLTAHQRPKDYVQIHEWPRNEAGKLNRARLRELTVEALRTGARERGN